MRNFILVVADCVAALLALLLGPVLYAAARWRGRLPRMAAASDRMRFQLRSTHYYEPTYRESDLPAVTTGARDLPGLDLNEGVQRALLADFRFQAELERLPLTKASVDRFGHENEWYAHADAEILYSMIRLHRPARLFEVGSGESTLVARLAIDANRDGDATYWCEHLCIEPYQARWLEATGTQVARQRVETLDPSLFDRLGERDILFVDSSHVIRPWGDVLRISQQVLPRLRPGVIVHLHDIFTPRDYPEAWLREERKLWNEQYLLEAFLAFNQEFEVLCAANWLKHTHFAELAAACPAAGRNPEHEPGAFWFRRRPLRD